MSCTLLRFAQSQNRYWLEIMIARMTDQPCFTRIQSEIISFADASSKTSFIFREKSIYIFPADFISFTLLMCLPLINFCVLLPVYFRFEKWLTHRIICDEIWTWFSAEQKCQDKIYQAAKMLAAWNKILLWISLLLSARETTLLRIRGKLLSSPDRRLVTRPIRCFLDHNQFPVSTQHHVRTRVCIPTYVVRSPRILCRSCVSGSRFSRVLLLYFPCVFR